MDGLMAQGYKLADVAAMSIQIRKEFPDVEQWRGSYGFGLEIWLPGGNSALVVYRPYREEAGWSEVITPMERVREWITKQKAGLN
jgi:hypothetical protein